MKIGFLKTLIRWLVVASFFAPLVVLTDSFIFPFIVPKILFFRSVVVLMGVLYLALLLTHWKEVRPRLTWIHGTVFLFFLSFFVSTFVGVDWYRSFWDNHERMLGLFTVTHFVVYYFIVSEVIREWREWQFLSRAFLIGGTAVMLIGFWQKLIDPDALVNRGSSRVSATLGNAIYYSGYGMFLLFLGIINGLRERERVWQVASFVAAAVGFFGILFGGTRGTLVGLILACGVMLAYYTFVMKGHKKIRSRLFAVLVLCAVVAGLLFGFRDTSVVRGIPAVGRLVNTSLESTTLQTRVMAWGIAIDAWKEKPVLGWGPNNYFFAFNKFYNPQFLRFGFQETWFDNAHSALFNTIAVQGLFGIITYILIFVAPIGMLVVAYRKDQVDIHFSALGVGFFVAHFVHNAFVFENPTSYLYFFWFLAFVNKVTSLESEGNKPLISSTKQLSAAAIGGALFVGLLFLYVTNINAGRANTQSLVALRSAYNLAPSALTDYEDAQAIGSPHIDDIRADFVRAALESIPSYAKEGRVDELNALYEKSVADIHANMELHPLDVRNHIHLARLYQFGATLKQDPALMEASERVIEDAISLSPKRQQLVYLILPIKNALGKQDEAISLLHGLTEDDPMVGHNWWRLAFLYQEQGDFEQARAVLEEAEQLGVKYDRESQGYVNQISETVGL